MNFERRLTRVLPFFGDLEDVLYRSTVTFFDLLPQQVIGFMHSLKTISFAMAARSTEYFSIFTSDLHTTYTYSFINTHISCIRVYIFHSNEEQ